jgi:DNA-binding response OmpR family regulator
VVAVVPQARNVLIVEDNALIAMEMMDHMESQGWTVVGPAGSLAEGLALAQAAVLDMAVLDVDLAGTPSWPIAHELQKRGIPFVFCTGYEILPPEGGLTGSPVFRKPVNETELVAAMNRLMQG